MTQFGWLHFIVVVVLWSRSRILECRLVCFPSFSPLKASVLHENILWVFLFIVFLSSKTNGFPLNPIGFSMMSNWTIAVVFQQQQVTPTRRDLDLGPFRYPFFRELFPYWLVCLLALFVRSILVPVCSFRFPGTKQNTTRTILVTRTRKAFSLMKTVPFQLASQSI